MGTGRLADGSERLPVGAAVTVRTRYLGSWTEGFEIAEQLEGGYRIRRVSDRSVLPEVVRPIDVRVAPEQVDEERELSWASSEPAP
jgi:hypothetical protein